MIHTPRNGLAFAGFSGALCPGAPGAAVKRLHDAEIALAGGAGVVAAHELVVQALQQLGHR